MIGGLVGLEKPLKSRFMSWSFVGNVICVVDSTVLTMVAEDVGVVGVSVAVVKGRSGVVNIVSGSACAGEGVSKS